MKERECVTLQNGLQIWLEEQPELYTASFGIWVASGSCMETAEQNGVSHFLEHMYFKGSISRSASELAARMDAIGGQMNAFTAKEYTCFYARTLTEHVAEGLELLTDMVLDPAMRPDLFETERGVVLEEISMTNDDPEDAVGERLEQAIWRASPYGMPILGTRASVGALTLDDLCQYRAQMYVPNRMAISLSGRFDRPAILDQLMRAFDGLQPGLPRSVAKPIVYSRTDLAEKRKLEQTHLCVCLPTMTSADPRRWALTMLNSALGGSSSSRLFQRIREDLGVAYSIGSDVSLYEGGGALYIQAAVNPRDFVRAADEIGRMLCIMREGITEQEFIRAREGLKSSLRMSMESSMSRAAYAGRNALFGTVQTDDVLLGQVEGVTIDEVNALAADLFHPERLSVSVCGHAPHDFAKHFAKE